MNAAQIELLALLSEELGEAQQIIGKILRHGYDSRNPLIEGAETNTNLLEKELGDVLAAIALLTANRDISDASISEAAKSKLARVRQWLHHADLMSDQARLIMDSHARARD